NERTRCKARPKASRRWAQTRSRQPAAQAAPCFDARSSTAFKEIEGCPPRRHGAFVKTLLLLLAGCSPVSQHAAQPDLAPPPDLSPVCDPLAPRAAAPEVSVLPDDGEPPQVNVLQKAQSSIRMMIYEMGYGGILDTIEAKAASGVQVRVILDQGAA